jgi:hypothetical protein
VGVVVEGGAKTLNLSLILAPKLSHRTSARMRIEQVLYLTTTKYWHPIYASGAS